MTAFHTDEYINFLKSVNIDTKNEAIKHSTKCIFIKIPNDFK